MVPEWCQRLGFCWGKERQKSSLHAWYISSAYLLVWYLNHRNWGLKTEEFATVREEMQMQMKGKSDALEPRFPAVKTCCSFSYSLAEVRAKIHEGQKQLDNTHLVLSLSNVKPVTAVSRRGVSVEV